MKTEPRTILVVDDDQEMRASLRTVLQQKGFLTLEADDGLDAKNLIDEKHPDLVILDMMMPRWGGFMVLEHYQKNKEAPPFIMITGTEGKKHQDYAEEIGVKDYIQKPFPMNRLLEGVEKIFADISPIHNKDSGTFRCRCSNCGAKIRAPLSLMGKTRRCPGCLQNVIISPQPPDDEGPILMSLEDGNIGPRRK